MKKIEIRKNGNTVKTIVVPKLRPLQQVFDYAVNIAGGMWNGKDEFTVTIVDA